MREGTPKMIGEIPEIKETRQAGERAAVLTSIDEQLNTPRTQLEIATARADALLAEDNKKRSKRVKAPINYEEGAEDLVAAEIPQKKLKEFAKPDISDEEILLVTGEIPSRKSKQVPEGERVDTSAVAVEKAQKSMGGSAEAIEKNSSNPKGKLKAAWDFIKPKEFKNPKAKVFQRLLQTATGTQSAIDVPKFFETKKLRLLEGGLQKTFDAIEAKRNNPTTKGEKIKGENDSRPIKASLHILNENIKSAPGGNVKKSVERNDLARVIVEMRKNGSAKTTAELKEDEKNIQKLKELLGYASDVGATGDTVFKNGKTVDQIDAEIKQLTIKNEEDWAASERMTKTVDALLVGKVGGMQAAKESLNTVLTAAAIPTLGLSLMAKPFLYAPLAAIQRYQELTKKREFKDGQNVVSKMTQSVTSAVTETWINAWGDNKRAKPGDQNRRSHGCPD